MTEINWGKKFPEGTIFYLVLKIYPHDLNKDELGDGLIPVYFSEEELIKNNPGRPYIKIRQLKDHKISVSVKGINDPNI